MIQYIKRKNLNIEKYDSCIAKSIQSRIYAFSWYLDIVADNWDVLVLGDYEAVMPIPWKQKYFLKYVVQPLFCQQLGVFSKNEIKVDKFIDKIPFYYFLVRLNLNTKPVYFSVENKQNYSLKLNRQYLDLHKSYRKDRKKSLRKSVDAKLYCKDFNNMKELISLYKNVFAHINNPKNLYVTIEGIISFCLKNNLGFIRNVYYDNELVCAGFFANYNNRIYYLFAASSLKGKKYGATTFLLDSVIYEYENTKLVLDFEGSSIPSIENFYKSFGSKNESYYHINYLNLLKLFSLNK